MGASTQPQAGPSNPHRKRNQKKPAQKPLKTAKLKKLTEKQKLDALERDVMNFVPPEGLTLFSDLPISEQSKRGLKKAFFMKMTDIQAQSIPVSLKGKDVLGAARTGSGKTLAFLVPVLEILYRRRWGPSDGLGALVISPTRELAVQIFEVLRSIGGLHSFSAGLVIGGKNLKDESERLSRMNILVATPGRLLQHMDQTVGFAADNLQVLVLDEADRILDMGFSRTLTALLSHLPKTRQTLLFSATQTQSVAALARLSLKDDPVAIGLDPAAAASLIPQTLEQHYIQCTLDTKLDVLWSFIKTHLQAKTLVFLSSCKQVRFVFETFCRLHPGVPLLLLHGKQKQMARLGMYNKFMTLKHAVLFATDVAARGLDFPAVDWVVQVDAPEDAETYIHRVGRTARYERAGKALLFLMPSEEEGMKAALRRKSIEVQLIKIRASKTQSIENHLQNLAFQDPEIKYLGQRAFVSYLRSVHLHKDKSIFKLEELPTQRFAESLGLPGAPKIKFLSREVAKAKKNVSRTVEAAQREALKKESDDENGSDAKEEDGDSSEAGDDDEGSDRGVADEDRKERGEEAEAELPPAKSTKANGVRTKYDRMFERKNQNILSEHYSKLIAHNDSDHSSDSEDDFITLKRADHALSGDDEEDIHEDTAPASQATADHKGKPPTTNTTADPDRENLSKRKLKLGRAKRTIAEGGLAKKLVFDDAGEAHELYELGDADEWYAARGGLVGAQAEGRLFAEGERGRLRVADVVDREEAREKKRERKRKRKERVREVERVDGPAVVVPADSDVDDGYVSPVFDLPDGGSVEDEDEDLAPPLKRSRVSDSRRSGKRSVERSVLEDDEELALQLLRGSKR